MYIAGRQLNYDYVMPGWATILRNLMTTIRTAKNNNAEYKIYWERKVSKILPRDNNNNITDFTLPAFNIFFKNNIAINYIPNDSNIISTWNLNVFEEDICENFSKEYLHDLLNACKYEGGKYNIQKQLPDYTNMIPINIKEKYCECLNELELNDDILNSINNFYNNNFDETTISLIIRTWPEDKNRAKMFILDEFTSYINKYYKKNKIFISVDTDPNLFIDLFKQKCSNNIFFYNTYDTNYIDIYKKALINLYLASKTYVIIGSRHSNYPEFCWWLSNCKSKFIAI